MGTARLIEPERKPQEPQVFLATTADEAFWDKTHPLLYLGQWYRVEDRRAHWEGLQGTLLESPYAKAGVAQESEQNVRQLYERLLPNLGEMLNTLHGTAHGVRYWRILLGPWLHLYLSATWDRYLHLRAALESHPGLTTLVLAEDAWLVPSDTLEFAYYLKEDLFNLQIFSRLLHRLGHRFPSRSARIRSVPAEQRQAPPEFGQKFRLRVTTLMTRAVNWQRQPVLMKDAFFPRAFAADLVRTTSARVFPLVGRAGPALRAAVNPALRASLHVGGLGSDEFESCLSRMLIDDMPACFIEGYAANERASRKAFPRKPRAVLSANAWYYEEAFKFWAAAAAEEGAMLIGAQHGGNYGALETMPSENHETAIVDTYYSWGWNRPDCHADVVPMPVNKFVGKAALGANNRLSGILWVATSSPRYLQEYPFLPDDFADYLSWQQRFAKALDVDALDALRLRPHREDNGWNLAARLQSSLPGLPVEGWEISFQESLAQCRLYVCDHLSTTFAEAISLNKPTILFWNPRTNRLRPEAEAHYQRLRDVGILFDSPEAAASAVSTAVLDIEAWWGDPERQQAVAAFAGHFFLRTPDSLRLWAAELMRVRSRGGVLAQGHAGAC